MGDQITFNLKGADALVAKFRTLPQELQRQIVVPAAKESMRIVLAAAKDNAARIDDPKTKNYIPKNLDLIEDTKFFDETGSTKVSVGVRKRKKGVGGGNTYYAALFLELGTVHARAFPFMRNALANNKEAVFQEFLSVAKFKLLDLGV